jgi:hypothetical protein
MIDQYLSIKNLGEKDAVITISRHSWFLCVLDVELSYFMEANIYRLRYTWKNTPRIRLPVKYEMILDIEEETSLFKKLKRWNTQKMINILYILNSDIPENIKLILYKNPLNIDDIPQIVKFNEPIEADDTIYKWKPYVENKKDLRCRLNNVHNPEKNIKWVKNPFKILTKHAINILIDLYIKILFVKEYKKVDPKKIFTYWTNEIIKLKEADAKLEFKKKLEKCMYLIEDENFMYIDENNSDQELNMDSCIILLQIFKENLFKNNLPHITFQRCLNNKIKNWKEYHYWWSTKKIKSWEIMTEEEEIEYQKNYNPPCCKEIYYKTFKLIKEKAWIQLKNNFILDFKENPRILITFLNRKEKRIEEIKMEYKKILNPRTKWKSMN